MTGHPILLKQEDAARHLAMSPKTFRQHVMPEVKVVLIDSQPRYPYRELERWALANAKELGAR